MSDTSSTASQPEWGSGTPATALIFAPGSPVFEGATALAPFGPFLVPAQYSSPREEFLAARTTAWLGTFLNTSPVFDVTGPDAVAFLNSVAVNRDFGKLPEGGSRHMIICNDDGQMLADGLCVKLGENHFRTYWLAPVLDFHLRRSALDVHGSYVLDEYFFQVDGPKSLEIMEKVTGADLHGLRFGRNTRVALGGGAAVVHRLGMSGSLAYEVHGHSTYALAAYEALREAVEAAGGKPQGFLNYALGNHTIGGYPNQFQHFLYPYAESGSELAAFIAQVPHLDLGLAGSAADSRANVYLTPYDVGWGNLVNFDHDFPGKTALQRIAQDPPRQAVTLEWNADDVAAAFSTQLRGRAATAADLVTTPGFTLEEFASLKMRVDYVLADGGKIGVTAGRTIDYRENRMVSLAFIEREFADEGSPVVVLWGDTEESRVEIRATVAPMPYFRGDDRNEVFDTTRIPVREP
ncbi:Glycine cleavage system T protein (aminomethyltransferase) [Agreia bicolorata]|uniref:Glycine cleavage system T protein (Aminomethyltransferase) n=1 Tax=Agreia bicolorata TaxID=110935 RepID=A0A1T4XM32_9MICO|nr:aminomethyltransferase family protein [Agreia bicolorata]SKA90619.1 Glycine cleavage system T protein (aminomethyltransferase) [Agreia bicolorata]